MDREILRARLLQNLWPVSQAGLSYSQSSFGRILKPFRITGLPGSAISALSWPLGVGEVGRGTIAEFRESVSDTSSGLVLGLAGDSITVRSGEIRLDQRLIELQGRDMPTVESTCSLDVHVPARSILVIDRFMSSWLTGKKLRCAQFLLVDSRTAVNGHWFLVMWPWELFGFSRIELRDVERATLRDEFVSGNCETTRSATDDPGGAPDG